MKEKIIAQGAEAIIYQIGNKVIKNRIPKSYRLKELDESIRKRRTKSELKLLKKASEIINIPKIINIDNEKQKDNSLKIELEYLDGKKLSEHLDKLPNSKKVCEQIGEQIAKLHDHEIIHGDLTTSNMIYVEEAQIKPIKKQVKNSDSSVSKKSLDRVSNLGDKFKVYIIDFGLGYTSNKIEDKAVDLHLIKQALEARHYKNYESFWKSIEKGYSSSKESKKVIERLKAVESRGRYKKQY